MKRRLSVFLVAMLIFSTCFVVPSTAATLEITELGLSLLYAMSMETLNRNYIWEEYESTKSSKVVTLTDYTSLKMFFDDGEIGSLVFSSDKTTRNGAGNDIAFSFAALLLALGVPAEDITGLTQKVLVDGNIAYAADAKFIPSSTPLFYTVEIIPY